MTDTIRGPVTKVLDGDTFEMKVTHTGKMNTRQYNDIETVRIAGIDAPEYGTQAGEIAKNQLQRRLLGKEVRCSIQARDTYRRIVAEVVVL